MSGLLAALAAGSVALALCMGGWVATRRCAGRRELRRLLGAGAVFGGAVLVAAALAS